MALLSFDCDLSKKTSKTDCLLEILQRLFEVRSRLSNEIIASTGAKIRLATYSEFLSACLTEVQRSKILGQRQTVLSIDLDTVPISGKKAFLEEAIDMVRKDGYFTLAKQVSQTGSEAAEFDRI
jgi:hypothetical protein